jgi:hypothetical protein
MSSLEAILTALERIEAKNKLSENLRALRVVVQYAVDIEAEKEEA